MNLRPLLAGTALAAAAVPLVPTGASAAALAPDRACYITATAGTQPIAAGVSGLAAGQSAALRLTRNGQSVGSGPAAPADALGNAVLGISSWYTSLPFKPANEVTATLEAVDTTTNAPIPGAAANVALARLAYSVTGSGRLRTWKIQGLGAISPSATYYAHYENHGKYKGRLKIGTGRGPCGYLKTKRPLTPFKKIGRYDVTIEASRKLDKTIPRFKGRVYVRRTYR